VNTVSSKQRVCIVGDGHLSVSPRPLKEAVALSAAGYDVRVVSVQHEAAKAELDEAVANGRGWKWDILDVRRENWFGRFRWAKSALVQRAHQKRPKLREVGFGLERAAFRYFGAMRKIVEREPADLFIAHNPASLPVAACAARKYGAGLGFDFEDFYPGMGPLGQPSELQESWQQEVMEKYLPHCYHLTAASPGVASAVARFYRIPKPQVIANVFPLSERPLRRPERPLCRPYRVYWFSQFIGPDRGLRDAIIAIGQVPAGSVELHLRGQCDDNEKKDLLQLLNQHGIKSESLKIHPMEPMERLVALATDNDIGLALDYPVSENRAICMNDLCTNKVYTYLLAGLALAATGNSAREVFDGAGFTFPHGNPGALAAQLQRWLNYPAELQNAKNRAWDLGTQSYNWDREKLKFLGLVDQYFGGRLKEQGRSAQSSRHSGAG
jgi:glycosyltransferase involved in cell wall biosynthesis